MFKRTVVCNWSMSDGPEKLYRAPTPEQLRKADAIITQAWHPQKATPMVLARVVSTSDGASEGAPVATLCHPSESDESGLQ